MKWIRIISFLYCILFVVSEGESQPNVVEIFVEEIEAGGFTVPNSLEHSLGPSDNVLKIYLAGIPEKGWSIYYRVGFSAKGALEYTDWKPSLYKNVKVIDFPTGENILQIKARHNILGEDSNILEFKVTVARPWWRTWWFWGAGFLVLFAIFGSRELLLNRWEQEEKDHYKKLVELELRTLQLQMNPHFIFNVLNSIQSFILKKEVLLASQYLSQFGTLMRLFLDSSRKIYISIEEEVRLLELYCKLEKMRFDEQFTFEIFVDEDLDRNFEIPTMILQPFVENAINHGLRYKSDPGKLFIHFLKETDKLHIEIIDNGVGREKANEYQEFSKKGYKSQGIQITTERLLTFNRIHFGKIRFKVRDLYSSFEQENVGTVIEIEVPLSSQP